MENDKDELSTLYQKDKVLWEEKFKFLEKQKEQAKMNLTDYLNKFEKTLQSMQKSKKNELSEEEKLSIIEETEKKFQNKINKINESNKNIQESLKKKIR